METEQHKSGGAVTEHTPGPWKVHDYGGTWLVNNDRWGIHVPNWDESTEADARLIAAAPGLLAACRLALPHHQGGHSAVGAALRAAIARATGAP